jgi:alpha-beta hydrolase superfamily lysophospholipase
MSVDQVSSGLPTWFGPPDASLFGVLHIPENGLARAGVVICPPLGKEHIDSYRGLKLLAQRLCARGFAVLRFDYAGTGDSAHEQDSPAAVSRYQSSIRAAADYLRACGVPDIGLVGLRAGALLAGVTADSIEGLAGLVLWDPVTDGRRFLRKQRALYKMTVGSDPALSVDTGRESIPGLSLSMTAAAELGALKLPAALDAPVPVLLAVRPERADDQRTAALAASGNCTVRTVSGQAAFVEPASFVVEIPVGALFAITSWLHDIMPTGSHRMSPKIRSEAIVGRLDDGRAVHETIDAIGPNQLFAIRTSIADTGGDQATLLIHNTACEHHVGIGRVWVEAARELAGRGMAVLRYDRRGTGETGCANLEFPRIHSAESNDDVLEAISASGATPERLMMTGVCSGAWNSAYGALHSGAKSVVMFNLLTYSLRNVEVGPEELYGSTLPAPGDLPNKTTSSVVVRAKALVRRRLPYPLWLLLGRMGLTDVPEVLLKELDRAGVSVDVVLAPEDYVWFEKQRGERGVARLSRRGRSARIVRAASGDHSLLQREIQNFTREQLVEVAEREFAGLLSGQVQFAGSLDESARPHWRTSGVPCRGR